MARGLWIAISVVAVALTGLGCERDKGTASRGDTEDSPPRQSSDAGAKPKYTLDGVADDWQGVRPLFEEAGRPGQGRFPGAIDIKQVYFDNDGDHLYVFLRCDPTVGKRFKEHEIPAILGQLYFDTDGNAQTGSGNVTPWASHKIAGFEVQALMPLGVRFDRRGTRPVAMYKLIRVDERGKFDFERAIPGGKQSSHEEGALIAHGSDGVELAIPLKLLRIPTDRDVRVLLVESAHVFEEEGYSVKTYTPK